MHPGQFADPETRLVSHMQHHLVGVASASDIATALGQRLGAALLEGDLSPQSWLLALLATGLLVEGWRLAIFAIGRTDRALNAFARAVVDEDGGDDDF